MAQSLARIISHLVFSTKLRRPLIAPNMRAPLNAYLAGIVKDLGPPPLVINCTCDHVHVLFCLWKNHSLAKVVEELKKGSSKWVKTLGPGLSDFYWQAGYGAFSVSQSNLAAVRRYIADQEEHHRTMTFQEEFVALLKKHHVEYDERYVWD